MKINLITLKESSSVDKWLYPNATKEQLIDAFFDELKEQHYSTLSREGDKIKFTRSFFDLNFDKSKNIYGNFSEGFFEFKNEYNTITIKFEGKLKRGFMFNGILPIILLISSLILNDNVNIYTPIAILIWPIFMTMTYYSEKFTIQSFLLTTKPLTISPESSKAVGLVK